MGPRMLSHHRRYGAREGKHLHFSVYDGETGSSVNRWIFFPGGAGCGTPGPMIKRVFLFGGDQLRPLQNGTVTPPVALKSREAYDLRGT